jgi:hypothetical protein
MRTTVAAGPIALLLLLAGARPAAAQLTSLETEDLRLVSFGGAESYLVPYATRTFLNAMRFHRRLFDYRPTEKTTVLLADFSDAGNAGATSVPRDAITIQIAPLSYAFETLTANERMNTIMNHELVHVVSMDQAAGSDRAFRHLFAGKVMPVSEQPESILYFYLTTPRVASPRWFLEGGAVFVDTWMSGGIGRAQGAYDEMVFRSMVKDDSRFYDPLGLASEGTKVDFQLQVNSYLYGARFIAWLGLQHSPEKVVEWIGRKDGSRAYYASQFRLVFGRSLEDEWRDWTSWERTFQQANLEAIRRYPPTAFKDLSKRALGSVSRAFVDLGRKKIYAAFNYPGVVAHVGAISLEDGSVERLVDIKGPSIYTVTSMAYDPEAGTVFYTTDNGAFRDLVALDPRTRKTRTLLKDARIGDLAFDRTDRSLWGIRHFNGVCTLVRIQAPYKEWSKVYSWPFGQVAYDLDVSPDGKQVSVSLGEVTGRHGLRVMPVAGLLAGDPKPGAQFDFGTAIPSNFTFSDDGLFLYGSSYYTGVSNIFRYEIATGKLEAMSNTETGFFRPVPLGGDELVVFRFTGQGFVPARIRAKPVEDVSPITFLGERLAETHPVVKSWMLGSPAAVSLDTLPQKTRPYHLARSLGLESLYPVAQGYKDFGAVGLRANFSDPLQLNRAILAASYTPDGGLPSDERLHLRAEYHRYDWSARFKWNDADFYDLVGPTKTGRKGYQAGLGWQKTLVYDEPRRLELTMGGSLSGNLDRLPDFQNVAVDVNRLFTLNARLDYSDVRGSLGHVDDEKGKKASLVFAGDSVDGDAVPRLYGTVDLGLALPIRHSSLWLRSAAGFSPRDRANPFANFFFGGFGNNWVDHGEEKRYREYHSLPGAEIDEIGGRNFVKSTAEWNLPPVRFRRVGTPGLYLTWARPALFATVLATDLEASPVRRVVSSVGGQLDFRITLLSTLDLTVSVGYAAAFEDGFRARHEGMLSLKVLK